MPDVRVNRYRDWLGIDGCVRSHYDLLGVTPSASSQEIETQFHERYAKVRQYHIGQYEDESQKLLSELSAAYKCLRDPKQRQAYDRTLLSQSGFQTVADFPTEPGVRPASAGSIEDQSLAKRVPPKRRPPDVATRPAHRQVDRVDADVAIDAEVESAEIVDAETVEFVILKPTRKLPILSSAILGGLVIIAGYVLVQVLSSSPGAAASYPVTGEVALVSIRIDRDAGGATSARMILHGSVTAETENDPFSDHSRFEAIATDPHLIDQLAQVTSTQESSGEGDSLMIVGVAEPSRGGDTHGRRIAPKLPLITLTSLSYLPVASGNTVGFLPQADTSPEPTPAELQLLQQLRSPAMQVHLKPADMQMLEQGRDFWRVLIGQRQFVITFADFESPGRYDEVVANQASVSVEPSGTSRGCQIAGEWKSVSELRGSIESLAPGSTVRWTGRLSNVRIVPSTMPKAGVYLTVFSSSKSQHEWFEAFSPDVSFARDLADFATASGREAGEQILIEGSILESAPQAGASLAVAATAATRRLKITSIQRERDGLQVQPGQKRTPGELKLSDEAVEQIVGFRTVGTQLTFRAKVESIITRDPMQLRVRPRGPHVLEEYVLALTDPPAWIAEGAEMRVEGLLAESTMIPGETRRDFLAIKATSVSPTYGEFQRRSDSHRDASLRFPLVLSARPPSGLTGSLAVKLDDTGESISLSLPYRLPSDKLRALRALAVNEPLEGEFVILPDQRSSWGRPALKPSLSKLYRPGETDPIIQFVSTADAPVVPRYTLSAAAPVRTVPATQIYLTGQASNQPGTRIAMGWSPSGELLATAGSNQDLAIWDATGRGPVRRFPSNDHASGEPADQLGWSPRADVLFVSSLLSGGRDRRAAATALWSLPPGNGGAAPVAAASEAVPAFSPDGRWLFLVQGGSLLGLQPPSFQQAPISAQVSSGTPESAGVFAASVDGKGVYVATLERSSSDAPGGPLTDLEVVIRRQSKLDEVVARLPADGISADGRMELAWGLEQPGNSQQIAVCDGKQALLLTWSEAIPATDPPVAFELPSNSLSHDRHWKILAATDATGSSSRAPVVRLFDCQSGTPTCTLEGIAQYAGAFSVSPGGDRIAVAIDAANLVIAAAGKTVQHQLTLEYGSPVVSCAWSPSGSQLATYHSNQVINVWSTDPAAVESPSTTYVFDWTETVDSAEAAIDSQDWATYHAIYPELVRAVKEKQLTPDQMSRMVVIEGKRKKEAARLLGEFMRFRNRGNPREFDDYITLGLNYLECEPNSLKARQIRQELARYGY